MNPPPAPATVNAKVVGSALAIDWVAPPSGGPFTNYLVIAYDQSSSPAKPVARRNVAPPATTVTLTGLPAGTYKVGVRAFNAGGFGAETQSGATPFAPAPTPFKPGLPPLSSDPVLLFDVGRQIDPSKVTRRLTGALAQANKWRYEYLKTQAVRAAGDALVYEQHIAQLMQMALSKVSAAEMLLSPVLQAALTEIQGDIQSLEQFGLSDLVSGVIQKVGDVAGTALALEALITFLLEETPIDFWVGLFDGMIDDVCHFDTGLSRTKKFLGDFLATHDVGRAILATITDLTAKVDEEVEAMAGPLRDAVGQIVGGTSKALQEILGNFDATLIVSEVPPPAPDGSVVLNANPLAGTLDALKAAVDNLIAQIKKAIHDLLADPLNLVVNAILVFICLPILGALVISFFLGPIAGGILAAIVEIAVVELIHLLARLLAGPLLDALNDAKKKVLETLGLMRKLLDQEVKLLNSPADRLKLVAGSLLEMKSLLPTAFLADAAALLGEARRALMDNATELALAAERALGLENATAFDVIAPNYDTRLTPAPQMPGGADPTRLAGAAMVRDFNHLERQRTRLLTGKEIEVTHRLSLYRILGGVGDPTSAVGAAAGGFSTFLGNGKMLLHLSEDALVDRSFPGLYRSLITDVRPIAVFGPTAPGSLPLPVSIPLSVTHTGPARTRVKRDANPAAPPVRIPPSLTVGLQQFSDTIMLGKFPLDAQHLDMTLSGLVESVLAQAVAGYANLDAYARPFYRFYGGKGGHFYGTGLNGTLYKDEDDARSHPPPGYGYERIEGYIYTGTPPAGAVALYRFWNADKDDHLYAIGFNSVADAKANPPSPYTFIEVAGYVYPTSVPGTVPLFRFWDDADKFHFYQIGYKSADDAKANPPPHYAFEKIECYVLINPTSVARPDIPILEQIKQSFLRRLPDVVGTSVNRLSGGVIDIAIATRKARQIILRLLADPLPPGECTRAPDGTVTCPDRSAVEAAVRALHVFETLRDGFPYNAATAEITGVKTLVSDAFTRAIDDYSARIAKWGGSTLEEDRDPHIRGLGFVTLVQSFQPETAVFNLLPDTSTVSSRLSSTPPPSDGQAPATPGGTWQYRPFENRGLEGDFLLSLESTVSPGALVDLLLEITVRGVHDEDLAAAVKASRVQAFRQLDQVQSVAATVGKLVVLPGTLPELTAGATSVRTFHLSLRGHRDNLLQMASAAADSKSLTSGSVTVDGLTFNRDVVRPLASSDGFKSLTTTPIQKITLQFQSTFARRGLPLISENGRYAAMARVSTNRSVVS
ncbi:MAG: fibronectin type III domain-containing protein [Actinomycetota bacterium]|nr:fibronectin type III domain-containing protein [Actinomycetota bacterium]